MFPLSVHLSVCLSVRSYAWPSVPSSACLPLYLSIFWFVCPSVRPFLRLTPCLRNSLTHFLWPFPCFLCLSIFCLSICQSILPSYNLFDSPSPFIFPFLCLSVRPSVHPFLCPFVGPSLILVNSPFLCHSISESVWTICLFICLPICIYLTLCSSVCLYVWPPFCMYTHKFYFWP